jgi:hypothetical protein
MSYVKRLREKHRRVMARIERTLVDNISLMDVDNDEDEEDDNDDDEEEDPVDVLQRMRMRMRMRKRIKPSFNPTAKGIYGVCRPEFVGTPLLDVLVDMVLSYVFWMENWSLSIERPTLSGWGGWDMLLEVNNESHRISTNGLVELFRPDSFDLIQDNQNDPYRFSLLLKSSQLAVVVKPIISGDWIVTGDANNMVFTTSQFSIGCKLHYEHSDSYLYWLVNDRDDQPFLATNLIYGRTINKYCGQICLNQDKQIDRIIFYLNTSDLPTRPQ